jgi:nucleotide-binding universal stress UspA family protein
MASAEAGAIRVLIGLDGSRTAERALSFVATHFPNQSAEVHLLSILEATEADAIRAVIDTSPSARYRRLYLRACAQDMTGFTVRCIIAAHDDPAAALVDYAQRAGIDLLALTSHGRGGHARPLGSVVEAVVAAGVVPVLLVPAE